MTALISCSSEEHKIHHRGEKKRDDIYGSTKRERVPNGGVNSRGLRQILTRLTLVAKKGNRSYLSSKCAS